MEVVGTATLHSKRASYSSYEIRMTERTASIYGVKMGSVATRRSHIYHTTSNSVAYGAPKASRTLIEQPGVNGSSTTRVEQTLHIVSHDRVLVSLMERHGYSM